VLRYLGRTAEAESWLRRAAEAGNGAAWTNLGLLLVEEGQIEEAQPWLRAAPRNKSADSGT